MFGLEVGMAFLTGLIWWELVLFGILVFEIGASLYKESALGFVIGISILTFVNWSGMGSIWATMTLTGLLYYGVVFIIIGIGWSLFKWKLIVQNEIEKGKLYNSPKDEVKREINYKKDYDTIAYWILLWPFSLLGYVVNDFICNAMKKLINKINTLYDRITDRLLSDYQKLESGASYR